MSIEHWMMFGTFASQRHFVYPTPETYAGVVINANMVAHAPAGIAAFLLERTKSARYLVDPLTHAFQHDPEVVCDDDGKPKPALCSLAEAYGEPFKSTIGRRPLCPGDFNAANIQSSAEGCASFQKDTIVRYMAENASAKYVDARDLKQPHAIVAPYFYLTARNCESWLGVMAEFAGATRKAAPKSRILGSIVVARDVLTEERPMKAIHHAAKASQFDGYLVWIDGLDEQNASKAELRGALRLVRMLRSTVEADGDVISLHGGYFSVLAAGNPGHGRYFTGVTHGPEFGEFRSVVPVGGGIPIARYYVPKLHSRVRYREAQRIFSAMGSLESAKRFHDEVCACPECQSVIDGKIENFVLFGGGTVKNVRRKSGIVRIEFPLAETTLRCLRHYLQRKKLEYEWAGTKSSDDLLAMLEQNAAGYEATTGPDAVAHLRQWREVLSEE